MPKADGRADGGQTFARMLEFFTHEEHDFIRSSLANSLSAIMCQRLLPGIEEGARVPATEALLSNATARDEIRRRGWATTTVRNQRNLVCNSRDSSASW